VKILKSPYPGHLGMARSKKCLGFLVRNVIIGSILFASGCGLLVLKTGDPLIASSSSSPTFDPATISKLAIITNTADRQNVFGPSLPVRLIEDQFLQVLLRKNYIIASRSDVETVLREIKFQQSGITDRDIAKLGRMLNVPAVLVVTLNDLKTRYVSPNNYERYVYNYETSAALGARLVSVEKAEILWVGNITKSFRVDQG
jgi:hypothetical protein